MDETLYALESSDGIRSTWKYWPNTKAGSTRNIIPISIIHNPRKEIEGLALVEYEAVLCSKCKGVLNSYCIIDFSAKVWACCICLCRNVFPAAYKAHISETTLPTELMKEYTTMEYILPPSISYPPIFVFIVDTCTTADELNVLKSSLQQSLNLLPAESLVGFISFGKHAYLYNLTWSECSRCHAFKGDRVYDTQSVKEQLGLLGNDPRGVQTGSKKFLMPASECEFTLNYIIEDLRKDPWPVPVGHRPLRCTGNAILLGVTLLEITFPGHGGRVMLFTGGVPTYGPGQIAGELLIDSIRTQNDVKNDKANYMKAATSFYEAIATKACNNGHCFDIFCCAIDQIGIMEMRSLTEKTGGYIILTDTFKSDVFKLSLNKIFARDDTGALKMGFKATIELHPSNDIKICGAIGPGYHEKKKNDYTSEIEIGMSQTSKWRINSIDPQTTMTYYLDIISTENDIKRPFAYLQFQTKYQHSSGRMRMRVTTVKFQNESESTAKIMSGFDQEAAAVCMAKWVLFKIETEESIDVVRWLDRNLIKLIRRFGDYQLDSIHSFRLRKEFSLYPQFMFHLRRSQFLQSFNVSPDESAYYKILMFRENVNNCLLMIQPALLQYSFDSPQPEPVLLDIVSLKNNVILLLDTFFNVLIWHGDTIAKWVKLGYQDKEDYQHFKALLQIPKDDAQIILNQRFPMPKFQETQCGKGPERLLKAKVNPSGGGAGNSTVDSGNYFTEDVSLKVFMDSLIQYVVKS
jgi:protein transport protein SEC23